MHMVFRESNNLSKNFDNVSSNLRCLRFLLLKYLCSASSRRVNGVHPPGDLKLENLINRSKQRKRRRKSRSPSWVTGLRRKESSSICQPFQIRDAYGSQRKQQSEQKLRQCQFKSSLPSFPSVKIPLFRRLKRLTISLEAVGQLGSAPHAP
jgi:hypothetical protein